MSKKPSEREWLSEWMARWHFQHAFGVVVNKIAAQSLLAALRRRGWTPPKPKRKAK